MADPKIFKNEKYEIKASCVTVVITLWGNSFTTFTEAINTVAKEFSYNDKKIMFMQTIDKDNEPKKVLIVFEF